MRGFRQLLAGLSALACLTALIFALLRWRVNTPKLHLDFGGVTADQPPGQNHE